MNNEIEKLGNGDFEVVYDDCIDYSTWVGGDVLKKSGKPFKCGAKMVKVKSVTVNEHSGKDAFVMEDGSVVDCRACYKV